MRRLLTGALLLLAACSTAPRRGATATRTSTTGASLTTSTAAMPPTTATAPPSAGRALTAADLPASWRAGCPVSPSQLHLLSIPYWGFDSQAHTGSLVVNASVSGAVTRIFARLYDQRFPIRQMQPVDAYGGDDERSLQADNTAAFNCRSVVGPGPARWSVHAYGEAVDVNPVENPYLESGKVHPAAGAEFLTRSQVRPGMAVAGGPLVAAFAAAGWQWGGRWSASPDYQHFSATGG